MKRYITSVLVFLIIIMSAAVSVTVQAGSIDTAYKNVSFDTIKGNNESIKNVKEDLLLPLTVNGVQVIWLSSDENIISIEDNVGVVKRPPFGEGYSNVFLTAVFVTGQSQRNKTFLIRVEEESIGYTYSDKILNVINEFDRTFLGSFNPLEVKDRIVIPSVPEEITLTVHTEPSDIVETDGTIHRSYCQDGFATIYFEFSYGYEKIKMSYPLVVKAYTTQESEKILLEDMQWLKNYMEEDRLTNNIELPLKGPGGSAFSWSSNSDAISNQGVINRGAEDQTATLTVKAELEKNIKTETFTVIISKKAPNKPNEEGGLQDGGSLGSGGGGGGGGGGASTNDKPQKPAPDTENSEQTEVIDVKYSDMPKTHWAYEAVTELTKEKIISGYNGNFRPEDGLLREEGIKLIVSLFDYELSDDLTVKFDDVNADFWAVSYINTAAKNGIAKGTGNGKFGTGFPITREDFAVLIYNAAVKLGVLKSDLPETSFKDDASISDYAREAVYSLRNAGIVKGQGDNVFSPESKISRAEAAQMLYNVKKIIK